MKVPLIKIITPIALGLVVSVNIGAPVSAQEIQEGTIEKGTIEKGTIEKGTIEKGTIEEGTIEGKEVQDKTTETKEATDKEPKSQYVKDSGEQKPELFEYEDLPKSVSQMILAGSIALTFVLVLIGTGRSIKYDSKSKH